MCRVWRPARHIIGHFGDESFQAINWTGTDKQKQGNKTLHTPETQKRHTKTVPANRTNYTLIWYAFYNLRSGNGVGPILTAPEPTHAHPTESTHMYTVSHKKFPPLNSL